MPYSSMTRARTALLAGALLLASAALAADYPAPDRR